MEGAVAGDHGDCGGRVAPLVSRTGRIAKRCVAGPGPIAQQIAVWHGPRLCSAALKERRAASGAQTYRTTPDVNPALRRGGLISFFRKQRASRPV